MSRSLLRSAAPAATVLSLFVLGLGGCSDAPSSVERPVISRTGGVDVQDVTFPIDPIVDFCGGSGVGTITDVAIDAAAGFAYSSSIFIPAAGGNVSIYFANLGPGPITFVNTGAWSVGGDPIPLGTPTEIPLTPTGSSAVFYDGYFGGTFAEGTAYLGCVNVSDVAFKSVKHKHATAHLDLSFLRDGVLHTVRVNIHVSKDIAS